MSFDVEAVRKDFPILAREVHGVPLVYLDSANSAQKPQVVIDAEADLYAHHYANVARAVHTLGSEVTHAYEGARDKVAAFLNAPSRDEIIFTRNITEALNLLAYSFSNATTFPGAERFRLGPGDEIVVTEMEHHSNIVPWQQLAQRTGATFRWIPIDDEGRLVESAIDEVINERTKVVSFVYQSNALGTINPVRRIVDRARAVGALSIVDAAQAAPHLPLDVQDARRRLRRLHRAQALRPDRRRRALGSLRPAGRPAAVPRRRRDDRDRRDGGLDLRRAAAPLRGRHADDRAGGRARHGRRLRHRSRAGQHPRAREGAHRLRARRAADDRRVCASSARPPRSTAARRSRSRSRAFTRTTSRSCSTSGASPSGPAITARARSACATEYRRRPERHSVCTPRPTRSTRWWPASSKVQEVVRVD